MLAALVRFSIRNPGAVLAIALAVLIYGVYSARTARLDVFPEFSPPQVVIQTEAPGFSAELVETLVSRPIEVGAQWYGGRCQPAQPVDPGLVGGDPDL